MVLIFKVAYPLVPDSLTFGLAAFVSYQDGELPRIVDARNIGKSDTGLESDADGRATEEERRLL